MSFENVKQYFDSVGLGERVKSLTHASATVEQAAEAIGCEPKQIAKTMSFLLGDKAILIVAAGDGRIDNKKYKEAFHQKARMIPGDEVESYTVHSHQPDKPHQTFLMIHPDIPEHPALLQKGRLRRAGMHIVP